MSTGWDVVNEEPATKKQRQMLHKYFGLYVAHPELVARLSKSEAAAIIDILLSHARDAGKNRGTSEEKGDEMP